MIISKISTTEYIYFNIHAEEVITSNFIEDNNSGIYGDRLQTATINRVIEALKTDTSGIKNIVFNFKAINACQSNLNKPLFNLKREGYKILFLNINQSLCEKLSLNSLSNEKNVFHDGLYDKFFLFENHNDPFTEIEINPTALFYNEFKNRIKKYIDPHQKPHTSSFVYLTSYVDMKKFMSYEKELLLYSLYKLASKISREWKSEIDNEPILICQSLNSTYIVSILSNLLKLDILIFDTIGPVNKLYNRLDKHISEKRKYIVVSDLVCLGTEVKIVKNLIHFAGGKYLGNVSIIKTETLRKEDINKEDATIAIFSINKDNNKELSYNITTNLETI